MNRVKRARIAILVLIVLLFPSIETGLAQSKKKKQTPTGTPVLWRKPNDIASRNLLLGPGGTAMRPVDDAIWSGTLLAQLSDRQVRDAFRAANYTPAQVDMLAHAVRLRTSELLSLRPKIQIGSTQ